MDSPTRVVLETNNTVAGVKRSAPGPLLPAFEPQSSPPCFKRHKSRVLSEEHENRYPTPVPSSSSQRIQSSPPPHPSVAARKPLLARSQSTLTERAPLSALPSITLPENGEPVLLGRSSNSSHYQLSANRLISRVHVKAQYLSSSTRPMVEIQCMGWNGVKIHCQGQAWELSKGDVFTSETEDAEIMLDVQDSRVVLAWPVPTQVRRARSSSTSTIGTPTRARVSRSPSIGWADDNDENIDPLGNNERTDRRLFNISTEKQNRSPIPPRRGLGNTGAIFESDPHMTDTFLEIYEDEPVADFVNEEVNEEEEEEDEQDDEQGDEDEDHIELPGPLEKEDASSAAAKLLMAPGDETDDDEELKQLLAENESDESEEEEEEEREEEPILHSYAPEPILPPMARFSTKESLYAPPATPATSSTIRAVSALPSSPIQRRSASTSPNKTNTVQNHIINQLAFSRLSSTSLTILMSHLPSALAASITKERLVQITSNIDCIGEIKRTGKDAAGKPLQSEYYYIPDQDTDEGRRAAVVEGMGRVGLRSCRKSHKQYYWRKPKKPTY
ncbi:uncharacterized protein H6S33_008914 [Morchella sextelata]|uniref:uncharacterized protein n=1 Tax=Morchella sextelata TaxID=1174677 RepID=UPI001D058BA6|nr:uncharacterized protein H6S33_008914 [Morchella sextelata]KAH0612534.1 hypothetical protein H6S33_008914 [Morchella sextelata]